LLAVAALVAFDRGAIDSEASGGLGLGHALLHRLDDLLSQVQRICTHASTIPGASSSQSAVSLSISVWHVWAWAGAVAINISSAERVSPIKALTPILARTFDTIFSFLH
jgi:hypothetical protein